MLKLSSLKADVNRETKGDWMSVPDWPDVKLKVSGINLPAFALAQSTLRKKWARIYKDDPTPQDTFYSGIGALYAKHLLHDWQGFDEPYTPERALELLSDPEYRELVIRVGDAASRLTEVNLEFVEEAEKNSAKRSVTK